MCDGPDTVISISPSRVMSCACAQSLSTCFVRESEPEGVYTCNYACQQSLDQGKRGELSVASTTSCQRASCSGECQGKRKASVKAPCRCTTMIISGWFYYRVKEFIILSVSYYSSAIMYVQSFLDVKLTKYGYACGRSTTTSGIAPARPRCLALH